MKYSHVTFVAALASLTFFGAGCAVPGWPVPQTAQQPTSQPATPTPTAAPAIPITAPTAAPKAAPKPAAQIPTSKLQPNATKPTAAATTVIVTMTGKAFSPLVVAINAGDTIKWVNKDPMSHTTVSDGALIWDSGNLSPGSSWSRVFKYAGSYNYHCGIHPDMKGTVSVR